MPQLFSTADVHPRDRLAYWVDFVCATLVRADCTVRRDQRFSGELSKSSAGELRIVELSSTAVQSVTRSASHIARDGADCFALTIQHLGGNVMSQDGHDAVLQAGDLVLHDLARPLRIGISGGLAQTVLCFPRSTLVARLGSAERFTGRTIDGAAGVAGMLSPLLRGLPSRLDKMTAATRERIARNSLDLIATMLLSQVEHGKLSSGMTLVRVKLWIETHLGEPLTAAAIASACRLSIRYLNRLFEREDTSVMHYVWERRLARCHGQLGDPAMRQRKISDIAFAAGFNDLAHFSRAYRTRYGCAPRDARRGEPVPIAP